VNDLFAPEAVHHSSGLSGAELRLLDQHGWTGPYPLLSSEGVARAWRSSKRADIRFRRKNLLRASRSYDAFSQRPWYKSMHAFVPTICEVASHPAIVSRINSILGPDIITWGVSISTVRPGQRHRWHVDVEHQRWRGVSIFLGLTNISKKSSLKVISGSHRIATSPQMIGVDGDIGTLATSRRLDPSCELLTVDIKEGEFFIFDGRLWHGSHNTSWKWRSALIAQYACPDAAIAIPLNYDEPIQWHPQQPPCVLVSGQDRFVINRLVPPPGKGAKTL
jgi:non-heme Fe2+,alpha-ketoglutarate-dependent halogenase